MENIDKPTKRLYFNVEITNSTTQNILAKSETTLLKPLFRDPENWDLCINRFRLPLNGIPLTRNNIPFEQWQVSLGFYNNSQWTYKSSYVPQYNPAYNTLLTPTAYALSHGANGAGEYLSVNPDLTTSQVYNSQNFSDFNSNILPTFDLYNNSGTYYYVSQDQSNVYCVYMKTGETYTINVPSQNVFTSIYADVNTNELYLSVYNQTGNTTASGVYARTNDSTWTQTGYYLASTSPITSVSTTSDNVFLNCGSDKVMYKYQKGNAYSTSSFTFQYPGSQHITYNNLIYHFETFPLLGEKLISVFDTSFNDIQNFQINNGASYIGLDNMNNILLSFNGGTQNQAIDGNGNLQYEFTTTSNFTFIFYGVPSSTQVPKDSGEYFIWSYQDYLTQINSALNTCYTQMSTAFSGTYAPTKAPELFFDPASRLFYIQADKAYADSTTYTIDFNQILYNMFLFPSLPDNNLPGSKSILIQDVSGSSPNFLNIYQESSSVAKFYDLVRILIQTSRIPVSGDSELANNSQLIITDVVPDTDTLSPSGLLIYQPTVLRFYNMYATSPFGTVDIYFSCGTKSGNIYPIYIVPNEYASCKIQFQKGQ